MRFLSGVLRSTYWGVASGFNVNDETNLRFLYWRQIGLFFYAAA